MIKLLLPIFSGVLVGLAFVPYSLWPLAIVGIHLIFTNQSENFRIRLIQNLIFGLALNLFVLSWVRVYVGIMPLLILILLEALPYLFLTFLPRTKNWTTPFIWGSGWVFIEYLVRNLPFGGFGWVRIGFADLPFVNGALRIFGVPGVTFLFISFSVMIALRVMTQMIGLLLILLISSFFGGKSLPLQAMTVSLVQGGIGANSENYQSLINATQLKSTSLIILPEDASRSLKSKEITLRSKLPIIYGRVLESIPRFENQAIFQDLERSTIYSKQYLTPFGEYIPLRGFVEKFNSHTSEVVDFQKGVKNIVYSFGKMKIVPIICYELLSDSLIRDAGKNSSFIVALTNTSTFNYTAEVSQELQIAKIRAIQTGRDIAYVATTAGTSIIHRSGHLSATSPEYLPYILDGEISSYSEITIWSKFGDRLEFLLIICFIPLMARSKSSRMGD